MSKHFSITVCDQILRERKIKLINTIALYQLEYTKNRIMEIHVLKAFLQEMFIFYDIPNHLAIIYATLTETQVFLIANFKVARLH